ncbi:glycosyltransferase family 1 protein [uncultured Draconibacterium sp.]|uniref:glycosyltransferase family 4 protein n=1 Tax=uncultured Draconibacterium sp. TaxID=1573823 RepID=UPI0032612D61
MKIGYDAKRAFLNTSGLGNYSRNTLNALAKYFPEHQYTLFTPEIKSNMLEEQEKFDIIAPEQANSEIKKAIWRSLQLSEEIEQTGVNLFHGLSNELPKGMHKATIPTLVTIHDLIFIRYPQFYKTLDRAIYFRKTKYACNAATRILAISEQTKADIIDFIDIEPSKIEVVHQAISPLFFENANTGRVKEKYKLPKEFVLAVGTVEERKNQLSILKAMVEKNIQLPLVLVGNPTSYCNDIHKYIAEKKLQNRVIFLKNIPENDLAAIYQLARLSIYISVFEGFGLPVIESMACGCPVITSNASCLPETAGDAAVLCSPTNIEELGNNMEKILTDTNFRKELIMKGRIRANEFQPKKYVEKLVSLYTELIK